MRWQLFPRLITVNNNRRLKHMLHRYKLSLRRWDSSLRHRPKDTGIKTSTRVTTTANVRGPAGATPKDKTNMTTEGVVISVMGIVTTTSVKRLRRIGRRYALNRNVFLV